MDKIGRRDNFTRTGVTTWHSLMLFSDKEKSLHATGLFCAHGPLLFLSSSTAVSSTALNVPNEAQDQTCYPRAVPHHDWIFSWRSKSLATWKLSRALLNHFDYTYAKAPTDRPTQCDGSHTSFSRCLSVDLSQYHSLKHMQPFQKSELLACLLAHHSSLSLSLHLCKVFFSSLLCFCI